MKSNGRTKKDEEELAEERSAGEPAVARSPAEELVSMQQSVGNQAVARMIGTGARVAREAAPQQPGGQPGQAQESTYELEMTGPLAPKGSGESEEAKKPTVTKILAKPKTFGFGVKGKIDQAAGDKRGASTMTLMDFTKEADDSSPDLLMASTGSPIVFATAELRHFKGGKLFMKYELKNATVVNYSLSGGAAGATESFSLNYSSIKMEIGGKTAEVSPPGSAAAK